MRINIVIEVPEDFPADHRVPPWVAQHLYTKLDGKTYVDSITMSVDGSPAENPRRWLAYV